MAPLQALPRKDTNILCYILAKADASHQSALELEDISYKSPFLVLQSHSHQVTPIASDFPAVHPQD